MRLYALINIFDLKECFLQPIFCENNKYYFQQSEDGFFIDRFIEADLGYFIKNLNNKDIYYIDVQLNIVKKKYSTLYGILYNGRIEYGDVYSITQYIQINIYNIVKKSSTGFKNSCISFIKKHKNVLTNNGMVYRGSIVLRKPFNEFNTLVIEAHEPRIINNKYSNRNFNRKIYTIKKGKIIG